MSEQVKIVDLGWCIAKVVMGRDKKPTQLTIVSPADSSDNVYQPASSVCVYGTFYVGALHKLLTECLEVQP